MVDLAFGGYEGGRRLWGQSGQALRARFQAVLTALRLPTSKNGSLKPLDPGSLRAGGATWHLQCTEDGEHCRGKGRWLSQKVTEVYVQETTALLHLKKIDPAARDLVLTLASWFPRVLELCRLYSALHLPAEVWHTPADRSAWTRWE